MGQVERSPEKKIKVGPADFMPKKIKRLDGDPGIAKFHLGEDRNFPSWKSVLPGGRKKKIFIRLVDESELEKKVPEIHSYARLFSEKRTQVKPNSHFELMYVRCPEMSRQRSWALSDSPERKTGGRKTGGHNTYFSVFFG